MLPKERAIEALELRKPDKVPHMEIEIQIHKQLLGKSLVLGRDLEKLNGNEKEKAIRHNVDLYIQAAEKLDISAITIDPLYWEFGHGVGTSFYYPTIQDQIEVAKILRNEVGDKYLIAVSMDATYGIPLAENMQDFVYAMFDNEEELLNQAEKNLHETLEKSKRLIDSGVNLIYNCSDYCFGTSCFFSNNLFEKYVYPYLKRQIAEMRKDGAYVIKHTDGNICSIIDFIVDANPHAVHSIDPMAGMDIATVKKNYGNKVAIMGNVDASKLEIGTKEEIIESATKALKEGMPGGGYIFSSCNTIFSTVPVENYLTMLDVRENMGWYVK